MADFWFFGSYQTLEIMDFCVLVRTKRRKSRISAFWFVPNVGNDGPLVCWFVPKLGNPDLGFLVRTKRRNSGLLVLWFVPNVANCYFWFVPNVGNPDFWFFGTNQTSQIVTFGSYQTSKMLLFGSFGTNQTREPNDFRLVHWPFGTTKHVNRMILIWFIGFWYKPNM